tara:strand:+ start:1248 stop:1571 length:324 start_codon:yes stop_codon:yes gene_type:complete
MSILERMNKAIEELDTDTMEELVHDDFQFYFHSNGKSIGKSDIIEWVKSGDVKNESPPRVLFENDEVGFDHSIVKFSDGNRQAVMAHYKFKDGKVIFMETGATNLDS